MAQPPDSLAVLDKFRTLLAKAETLDEVADLRSKADAVRVWAKSAAMGLEAQNRAAELKLRAERKAGEPLANLKLSGGNRKSNGHDDRLNLGAAELRRSLAGSHRLAWNDSGASSGNAALAPLLQGRGKERE